MVEGIQDTPKHGAQNLMESSFLKQWLQLPYSIMNCWFNLWTKSFFGCFLKLRCKEGI